MKQFTRFIVVGLLNTLIGYCIIFTCMYLARMSPEASNVAGYAAGLVVSYVLNRNYTFKSKQRRHSEFVRFLAVFGFAYGSNFALLLILIHGIDMHEGVSQVLSGVVYIGISFVMNKYYVFKTNDSGKGGLISSFWSYILLAKQPLTEKEGQESNCSKGSGHLRWLFFYIFCGFSVFYAIFFSPVMFGGREFLSDGQFAAFYSSLTLWSDAWAGGWPAAADLSQMMFSPLRHLFRHLPNGFNLFVVSSYVLISTFMFGYVHGLTRSRLAGIVSGLTLGLSGFMMAHLGHTSIISGAAWAPLLLWALDRLRHGYKTLWLMLGAFSVCIMMLSGHPQITAYSYLVGGVYALAFGFKAKPSKWYYWLAVTGVFVIGAGLAAFQWLPTYELSKATFRNAFSYSDFTAFSLPVKQVLMLFFPFFYGSQHGIFFAENYFGAWSYTELSGYAGVFSITLSTVALMARRDRLSMFWGFVALVAVFFALGDSLPWLAKLTYYVPVLNQFRVPSRHVFEYVMAISVLAGLGAAALQRGGIGEEKLKRMTKAVVCFFMILIMAAVFVYSKAAPFRQHSQCLINFFFDKLSPAVYIPVLWMVLSVLVLFLYMKDILGVKKEWLVLLIVTVEMVSFGWFHEWRVSRYGPPLLWHEEIINDYNNRAHQSQQKLISQKGLALPADYGRFSGIHSLNWYGPLLLKRYSEAVGINTDGALDPSALSDCNVGLDIFGGRYLFIDPSETIQLHGISWHKESLGMVMGNGCGLKLPTHRLINLPAPVAANGLEMVTQLGCSTNFTDGTPVGDVILHGVDGQRESIVLRAGIDTAEWAADCQDVIPIIQHRKAMVFESMRVVRPGVPTCDGHSYLAHSSFAPTSVAALEIKVRDNVTLNVHHLTLSDSQTGGKHVINPVEQFLASKRWRFMQAADGVSVYENMRAMPPAWLTFEAISLSPEQALAAIRTSVLPDGRNFVPARQALTEMDISVNGVNTKGKVIVVRHDDMNWEINAQSNSPGVLVIGQNYYPGWQATVDGMPVDLIKVNYSQQGLLLPAGDHKVALAFRPVIFMRGLTISGISLIGLLCLFWRMRHRPADP